MTLRQSEQVTTGQVRCEGKLDPNEILSREFDYAAQTAFQAHEDRVKVFNYYLATAGTLIAAVVLADLTNRTHLVVFVLLFGGLAILGFMSLLKLAKLRLAWSDSVRAMCQIKEYYVQMCDEVQLARAFRWTMETIPPVGKKWTVAFLIALTIGLLNSASAGGVVLLWGLAVMGRLWIIQSVLAGLCSLVGQLVVWFCICRG
jgi:hypothetical protein